MPCLNVPQESKLAKNTPQSDRFPVKPTKHNNDIGQGSTDEESESSLSETVSQSSIPNEISFATDDHLLDFFEDNAIDHGTNDSLWYESQVASKIQQFGPLHEVVAEAWNEMGAYAADELQDYDTALYSFRQAVQCENGGFQQAVAFARLGQTYNVLQNYDEAIPHLANAVRLFEYYSAVTHNAAKAFLHYQMGSALMNKGYWKVAARAFKESLELEPKNVDTLFALSSVYWHLDSAKATKYHARAVKILDRLAL